VWGEKDNRVGSYTSRGGSSFEPTSCLQMSERDFLQRKVRQKHAKKKKTSNTGEGGVDAKTRTKFRKKKVERGKKQGKGKKGGTEKPRSRVVTLQKLHGKGKRGGASQIARRLLQDRRAKRFSNAILQGRNLSSRQDVKSLRDPPKRTEEAKKTESPGPLLTEEEGWNDGERKKKRPLVACGSSQGGNAWYSE